MVWYFRLLKNFPQFVVIFPGGLDGKAGTEVRFLGQEDPLEKEMATYSSTLAWKIPWTEETGMLQSVGSQRDMTERLHFV